jgi:3-hydroxyisobutyrate dehydrogenase-like beta-hydroxyacid dehydrogenase
MKIESDERTNVGIIGTGLLGGAVAKRWLAAGWPVVAYDVEQHNLDVIAGCGATRAASVQDVFNCCRRIGMALPHSDVSRQVLRDVHPATRESIVLDMTTGNPVEMEEISKDCAVRGLIYLDTTVGGSSARCWPGKES